MRVSGIRVQNRAFAPKRYEVTGDLYKLHYGKESRFLGGYALWFLSP
jgi:hypothetical protein